jgi:hypothetical protein
VLVLGGLCGRLCLNGSQKKLDDTEYSFLNRGFAVDCLPRVRARCCVLVALPFSVFVD